MKFKIKTTILKNIINNFSLIINNSTNIIENSGLLIEIKENQVIFEGKNSEIELKEYIKDVEIEENGEFLIKFKYLLDLISKFNGKYVEFNLIENNLILIKNENNKYKITLLDNLKFKKINEEVVNDFKKIKVIGGNLINLLNSVSFAGDEKSSRKILQGINLITKDDELKAICSDNLRIAFNKTKVLSSEEVNIILPIKIAKQIMKVISPEKEVFLKINNNKISLIQDNIFINSMLIEGIFPDIEKVFKNIGDLNLKIDAKEMVALIENAIILNPNKYEEIFLEQKIIDGELVFKNTEDSFFETESKTKKFTFNSNDEFKIFFNPNLLLSGIKNKVDNSIKINYSDSNSPFIFTFDKDENFKCLILPYKTLI